MRLPNFPSSGLLRTLTATLRGVERVAGVVVEYERLRFAEFRSVYNRKTGRMRRVLAREGATFLPKGTIRGGGVVAPDALRRAFRELARDGKPQALTAPQIILAVPIAHVVGRTVSVPPGVQKDEIEGALQLEIESMLPFPIEETYTDWQVLRASFSSKAISNFFFASARHGEVDPYVDAAESAGLGVVAVEPITLSIARGLRIQEGSGVTYIALIHPDALLAAGVDAQGEVRLFHHRSLPAFVETDDQTSEGGRRAERIITELTSFLRFFRGEIGGEEKELIIDGVLDEITLQSLSGLGERLGLPVRFEHETHLLSRAAARGVALRALLPRRDDHLASLMKVGTEAAYAARQMTFFMRASLKTLFGGAIVVTLFLTSAFGILSYIERSTIRSTSQRQAIPPETQKVLDNAVNVNTAIQDAVSLLGFFDIPSTLVNALTEGMPRGVRIDRIDLQSDDRADDSGIRVTLAVEALTPKHLVAAGEVISERFSVDTISIPDDLIIRDPENIPFNFFFVLRSDFE